MAPKVRILREESSIQISACTDQCTRSPHIPAAATDSDLCLVEYS